MLDLASALIRAPDLVVGVVAATIGVLVLRTGVRKPANQYFALFMLLIAGNFLTAFAHRGLLATDASAGRLFSRIALQFLLFDPAVLLAFTLLYPRRDPRFDQWSVRAAIALPPLLLTAAHLALPGAFLDDGFRRRGEPDLPGMALVETYVLAFYLASLARLLGSFRHERSLVVRGQLALLVVGFGVAIVPRVALAMIPILDALLGGLAPPIHMYVRVGAALLVLAAAYAYTTRGLGPEEAPSVRRALRAMSLLVGAILATWVLIETTGRWLERSGADPSTWRALVAYLNAYVFSLRWIVFGLVVGYALLRYQLFDVDTRMRRVARLAAAATVLGLLAGGAIAAGAILKPLAVTADPGTLLALFTLVVVAPLAARWASREVDRRLPAAPTGREARQARRLEVYRAALEGAMRGGEVPAEATDELTALRRDLGITDEQGEVLVGLARLDASGRRRGALVENGRLAGRYDLGPVLGQGGFGRCRLARDALLGRDVVVKEVPRLSDEPASALLEARAAGRLNHPNIVTVHDILEGPGTSYLVMEHIEGGNLRTHLARGPIERAMAMRILNDMLLGLDAAHERGIVHGDLKPENVLLTADGRAKLADFGSAASAPTAGTLVSLPTRASGGTLLYMAPEQVEGDGPSLASDLYALAAIAHEMLVGEHYFELRGKGDFQIREAIVRAPPLAARGERLSTALHDWLARGLARRPAERWASASRMRLALARAQGAP